ncbi:MAG: diaminopimelate epimerase [Lachnospiraceae bacterium]|nr:diaminopimelate epimerase [Lachnospiraceae bacterium]
MKFTKMHGCGNDYIYVNAFEEKIKDPSKVAICLSDRHKGIGSDGLILVAPSDVADVRMIMYNLDGSEGAMCGNGIRCVGKFFYDYKMTDKTEITVETKSGIKKLTLFPKDGKVETVKVDMGKPILNAKDIPAVFDKDQLINEPVEVNGKTYNLTAVSMGNPHAVTFVDDTKSLDLEKIGPDFENHPIFPDRVNTEFVEIINRNEVNMRVWERGSGETFACGTGACATAVASVLNGLTDNHVTVHLLGGDLDLFYDEDNETVWMTGPATTVFEGEVDISAI